MRFNNFHVSALLNVLVCFRLTSSLVKIQNDKFHGYINGIYQKVTDNDSGQEWEFPVNKNKLELLRNDRYVHDTFTTCSKMYGSSPEKSKNQSNPQISFKENAKVCIFTRIDSKGS